jgi:hypothetical protein
MNKIIIFCVFLVLGLSSAGDIVICPSGDETAENLVDRMDYIANLMNEFLLCTYDTTLEKYKMEMKITTPDESLVNVSLQIHVKSEDGSKIDVTADYTEVTTEGDFTYITLLATQEELDSFQCTMIEQDDSYNYSCDLIYNFYDTVNLQSLKELSGVMTIKVDRVTKSVVYVEGHRIEEELCDCNVEHDVLSEALVCKTEACVDFYEAGEIPEFTFGDFAHILVRITSANDFSQFRLSLHRFRMSYDATTTEYTTLIETECSADCVGTLKLFVPIVKTGSIFMEIAVYLTSNTRLRALSDDQFGTIYTITGNSVESSAAKTFLPLLSYLAFLLIL